jgi:hypothetical protein
VESRTLEPPLLRARVYHPRWAARPISIWSRRPRRWVRVYEESALEDADRDHLAGTATALAENDIGLEHV